jgi:diguanylate cyclase (GGDEF)-like protein/PAS domain S-box-containing protein
MTTSENLTLLHYRQLFSENKAVFLFLNPDNGKIVDASVGACQYYGYPLSELTSMSIFDINILSTKEIATEIQRAKREQKNHFSFRHRLASGEVRDVEVYSNPINVEGHRFLYSIIHDVTERKRAEEALRESENKLSTVFQIAPNLMAITKAKGGCIVDVNKAFENTLGYRRNELLGHTTIELGLWESPEERLKFARDIEEHGEAKGYEVAVQTKAGDVRWILLSASSINLAGEPHFIKVAIDITKRRRAEDALGESETKLRNIVEHSTNLFYSHTPDHVLTYISPQTRDLLDCEPEQAMINWTEFTTDNPINEKGFLLTEKAIETGERQSPYELELIGKKGRKIIVEVNEAPLTRDGKTVVVVGALTDITERKNMEAELRYLSVHDPLTGLYNRKVLEQQLNDEIFRASRYNHDLSLFMLDIDHFKSINDTYGHRTGDVILKNFAKFLENSIRKTDYAARYGGEEFVVILPETPITKAEELAERLCAQIAENSVPIGDGKKLQVTTSIGIAAFPEHAHSGENLLEVADSAMYTAKKAGRNQIKTPS